MLQSARVSGNRTFQIGWAFNHSDSVTSRHATERAEQEFLFKSLLPVGLEAFVQNPSVEMEQDVRNHILTADHLLIAYADGTFSFGGCKHGESRPIAFRMWKAYELSVGYAIYLAGMCVLPSWQGKGVGQKMTNYALIEGQKQKKADYVFTRTQNPVAKLSMDKALKSVSHPNGGQFDYRPFAKALNNESILDNESGILKGQYGSSLYGKLPTSNNAEYNALFDKLDRQAGDAYLCVSPI